MRFLLFTILLTIAALYLLLFSYFWVDIGIIYMLAHTRPFFNSLFAYRLWGSHHQLASFVIYLLTITTLFILQICVLYGFLDKVKIKKLLILFAATSFIFTLSYNFASHDLFNYLFSAKLIWVFHQNPYQVTPRMYDQDLWVSFMHSIDAVDNYGVFYLIYSMIPLIIFGASHFILIFYSLRIMNFLIFFLAGLLLLKLNNGEKKVFSYWFLNPYLIIELLVNAHNDLLMIAGFIISMFFLYQRQQIKSITVFLVSIFTKSPTIISPAIFGAPALLLSKGKRQLYFKAASLALFLFLVVASSRPILNWYYTWVYMFLPFAKLKTYSWILIYCMGLILLLKYQNQLYPWYDFITWLNIYTKETIFILAIGVVLIEIKGLRFNQYEPRH